MVKGILLLNILFYFISPDLFSQCNVAWPTVSGANQTIAVNSRVATGNSLTGTLTVNAGVTLCTDGTAAITVSTLTNNGTIDHQGSGTFSASSTVVNSGTITVTSSGFTKTGTGTSFTNNSGALMNVSGNIDLSGVSDNYGTITTSGTFSKNGDSQAFTNHAGAVITASGAIVTAGNTINDGSIASTSGSYTKPTTTRTFANSAGATITAAGNIDISGTSTNDGLLFSTGGTFSKNGDGETFGNSATGTVTATGNISIRGITTNSGSIISTAGTFAKPSGSNGDFSNISAGSSGGILRAFGNISFAGNVSNCGLIDITNAGILTKTDDNKTLTNSAGSSICTRGAGISSIRGDWTNSGNIKIEGNLDTPGGHILLNNAGGYLRVCNTHTVSGSITNSGTIEILKDMRITGGNKVLTNNNTGVLNITHDLTTVNDDIANYGCITIGDSLYISTASSNTITISGGTIFCKNFLQIDGTLDGGSGAYGVLDITGTSETQSTVPLSGNLDVCDHSQGANLYFDLQSPAYAYPTGAITDCAASSTCTKATFITCSDAMPALSGSCFVLLPVELLNFNAICNKDNVTISWSTAFEQDNDYFSVERSADGNNFIPIAQAKGAGNSSTAKMYHVTDPDPISGVAYYRLKQVDYDGQHEIFPPASVNCVDNGDNFIIYPNPSNGVFEISVHSQCEIEVTNILGEKIYSGRSTNNKLHLDLSLRPVGIYLVRVKSEAKETCRKVLIVR